MRYFISILFLFVSFVCLAQDEGAKLLLQEGDSLLRVENWDVASLKYKAAYQNSLEEEWQEGELESLEKLAFISKKQNKPELQLKYLLNIAQFQEINGNKKDLFDIYEQLALLYQEQEIYQKSNSYFQQAFSFYPENKNELYEALAENHLLDFNYDSTRYYRNLLVDYYNGKNNFNAELFHKNKIADAWTAENIFNKSISIHKEILSLSERNNDEKNIIISNNNLGTTYSKQKKYEEALQFLLKSEKLCNERPLVDLSVLYSNIGIVYHNLGDQKTAVKYFLQAIKSENGKEEKLALNHKIAKIYIADSDLYNARVQNDLAHTNTNNKKLKSEAYRTAASISQALFEFEEAFDFYQKHLELEQEFRIKENLEKQKLLELQTKLERSEKEIRLEKAAEEIKQNKIRAEKERLAFENQKIKLEKEKIELERETKEKEIEILAQEQKAKQAQILAQEAELKAKELEAATQRQQLALATQKLEAERNARELEEAQRQQELQELELKAAQDREQLKQQELEASQEAQKAKEAIYKEQERVSNIIRISALIGGLLALFVIGLVLWFLSISRRNNKKLAQQNDEIEKQRAELETNRDLIAKEQEKSENLLLNILPAPIASELKEKGYATPKEYKEVTVLFTDFGGFTRISAKMDADELISELNTCFKTFDDIIGKYGIQPIKTIGDSYMCAGGVPIEGSVSPEDMIRAALEILDFMNVRRIEKQAQNIEYWDTRIGLHTGSIIAGVVGKKKFAYDIWGDAVNTASRMESGAELNSVNISEATYERIKNTFQCSFRGEFSVKNKGIMKMYQVDSLSS